MAEIVGNIAELTDINDHTGAAITLAASMHGTPGADDLRVQLVAIKEAHIKRGHMDEESYNRRNEICDRLMVLAKAHYFGPGEYDQINGAF